MELTASSPDCYFDVSVDGGAWRIVQAAQGRGELVLVENLAETAYMN